MNEYMTNPVRQGGAGTNGLVLRSSDLSSRSYDIVPRRLRPGSAVSGRFAFDSDLSKIREDVGLPAIKIKVEQESVCFGDWPRVSIVSLYIYLRQIDDKKVFHPSIPIKALHVPTCQEVK